MKHLHLAPAVALWIASGVAQAGTPFVHPAIAPQADVAGPVERARDFSPVLIGHPSSPRWAAVHANHEHPAVTQARQALASASIIDANTFIVQPPASVSWVAAPAEVARVAAAGL